MNLWLLVLVQSMLTSAVCWVLQRLCLWNGLAFLSGFVRVREIALQAVIVHVGGVV